MEKSVTIVIKYYFRAISKAYMKKFEDTGMETRVAIFVKQGNKRKGHDGGEIWSKIEINPWDKEIPTGASQDDEFIVKILESIHFARFMETSKFP